MKRRAMLPGRQVAIRCGQVLVSLGLLAYLIATIPMREVSSALLSANPVWLAAGFAFTGVSTLVGSYQMRAILESQGMIFSLRQVAGINLITMFYGLFLPSSLMGGVIRWHHFSTPEGKRAQALAAMIFNRIVELVTTLGFGIAFWYLATSRISTASGIATLILTLAAAVLIVMLSVSAAPHAALGAMLIRLQPARRLRERIFKISTCLVDFGRRGRSHQFRFLLLSIARNTVGFAAYVCFARAVHIVAPAVDLGWVQAAVNLVLILPISIAGLGVRDASLVLMLGELGVQPTLALALSFLLLGRMLVVALIGGIIEGLRIYLGIAPGLVATQLKGGIEGS